MFRVFERVRERIRKLGTERDRIDVSMKIVCVRNEQGRHVFIGTRGKTREKTLRIYAGGLRIYAEGLRIYAGLCVYTQASAYIFFPKNENILISSDFIS